MTHSQIRVRPARTSDVRSIQAIRQPLEGSRVLLGHELVGLYEAVPEFLVALDENDFVVGAGALHIMWEDLAEVRSMVVAEHMRGHGVGRALLEALVARAAELGIARVFCLTFEVEFFAKSGFVEISDVPVDPDTYAQMVRSHDDGVAEFLDLARVKQNTLGNTRMLKTL
ncbi:amino-acid N-acetyltransferase [Rhodoluna sp.]|uniref:amino-acid N-acetyltransferase n=1 Tax=Rhodoluna sp. TaxID=1969481 RepID=UPI0025E76BC4|nr:amino-acid N-acetyltransferase [Rhodoluna sp.]